MGAMPRTRAAGRREGKHAEPRGPVACPRGGAVGVQRRGGLIPGPPARWRRASWRSRGGLSRESRGSAWRRRARRGVRVSVCVEEGCVSASVRVRAVESDVSRRLLGARSAHESPTLHGLPNGIHGRCRTAWSVGTWTRGSEIWGLGGRAAAVRTSSFVATLPDFGGGLGASLLLGGVVLAALAATGVAGTPPGRPLPLPAMVGECSSSSSSSSWSSSLRASAPRFLLLGRTPPSLGGVGGGEGGGGECMAG